MKKSNFKWFAVGIVVLVILAIIVVTASNTRIQPGYAGVKYDLFSGLDTEDVRTEGLQRHSPFTTLYEYPISTETVLLNKENGNSFDVNTKDGKSVTVDVAYQYTMKREMLPHIFVKWRRADSHDIANTYIKSMLKANIQDITTQYSVLEVYGGEKRGEITAKISKQFTALLGEDGIIIDKFSFLDIVPDDQTKAAIQQIVSAKNDEERLKQEQVNKLLAQDTLKLEATKIAEKNRIDAEGVKAVRLIEAERDANAAVIEAKGRNEANALLNQSLSEKLLQKQLIDVLPQIKFPTIMGGGSNNILNIPQEMLKAQTTAK